MGCLAVQPSLNMWVPSACSAHLTARVCMVLKLYSQGPRLSRALHVRTGPPASPARSTRVARGRAAYKRPGLQLNTKLHLHRSRPLVRPITGLRLGLRGILSGAQGRSHLDVEELVQHINRLARQEVDGATAADKVPLHGSNLLKQLAHPARHPGHAWLGHARSAGAA